MSPPQLMEAFDFTPDELRINRAGQLSARQKALLDREDLQQTLDIGCALSIFVILIAATFGGCALLFNVNALIDSLSYVLPFVGAGLVILIVAALTFNVRGTMDRRKRPDVSMLEGTITVSEEAGGYNARHFLIIGDRRFRIRPQMFDALKLYPPETLFRVYYTERLDKVLSLESEIDGDKRGD